MTLDLFVSLGVLSAVVVVAVAVVWLVLFDLASDFWVAVRDIYIDTDEGFCRNVYKNVFFLSLYTGCAKKKVSGFGRP